MKAFSRALPLWIKAKTYTFFLYTVLMVVFPHFNVADAVDHFTSIYLTLSTSTRYLISTLYFEGASTTALFPRLNVMV